MDVYKKGIIFITIIILIISFFNNIYAPNIYEPQNNNKKALSIIDGSLNLKNEVRMNQLMYAIKYDDLYLINNLLMFETQVNAEDQYGRTPLMFAAKYSSNPQTIDKLIEANRKDNIKSKKIALIFATLNTFDTSVIDALINTNKLINKQDINGKTALMYAVIYNNMDIVNTLIKLGADGKIKDKDGKNALDYAKLNKNTKDTDIYLRLKEYCEQ